MAKFKDFMINIPRSSEDNNPLYLLARNLFPDDLNTDFIQSNNPPTEKHNIKIVKKYLDLTNDNIRNFDNLGPNEKYLINFVFSSESSLISLVGGIGVGKSRFCRFLINDVLHCNYNNSDLSQSPFYIIFNVLDETNKFNLCNTDTSYYVTFLKLFNVVISGKIDSLDLFDIEEEVTVVWEAFLAEEKKSVTLSNIIATMRSELRKLHSEKRHPSEIIKNRIAIRDVIFNDEELKFDYLAYLLRYIKSKYYNDDPYKMLIIIDNIDQEPPMLIREINKAVRKFSSLSKCKTIINSRQTTWAQLLSDSIPEIPELAPYCGRDSLDIISSRIDHFFANKEKYSAYIPPDRFNTIEHSIQHIETIISNHKVFMDHFRALCGHSIRKAFHLARNIICNSLYDISNPMSPERKELNFGNLCRAVVVGRSDAYSWLPNGYVENIFHVYDNPGCESYLIKIRILKSIAAMEHYGITLRRLTDILAGFNYNIEMIMSALNELKRKEKRLIWSDTVRDHFMQDTLSDNVANSKLFLSSSGQGYERILSKSINYIEEIMMDTYVPEDLISHGWNYERILERFKLVYLFLNLLVEDDVQESIHFVKRCGVEDYKRAFGSTTLITADIINAIHVTVRKILNSIPKDSEMKVEIDQHLQDYSQKIVHIKQREKIIFS